MLYRCHDRFDISSKEAKQRSCSSSWKSAIRVFGRLLAFLMTMSIQNVWLASAQAEDKGEETYLDFFEIDQVRADFEQSISAYVKRLRESHAGLRDQSLQILVEYDSVNVRKQSSPIKAVVVCCGYKKTELFLNLMRPGCASVVSYNKNPELIFKVLYLLNEDWAMTPAITGCLDDIAKWVSRPG